MAEIINLRQARKARARDQASAAAEANRARHGRTRADKLKQQTDAEREARHLDGARREHGPKSPDASSDTP